MSNQWYRSGEQLMWPTVGELRQKRNLAFRRPYAVLCYCSPIGTFCLPPWQGERVKWRQWRLLEVKTFKDVGGVQQSHSYQRLYSPFKFDTCMVVMGRTTDFVEYIVEYTINEEGYSVE